MIEDSEICMKVLFHSTNFIDFSLSYKIFWADPWTELKYFLNNLRPSCFCQAFKFFHRFLSFSFFLFVCGGLTLTAFGYIFASIYGLPLSWPALAGATILLTGGFSFHRLNLSSLGSGVSWSILPFIFSLALLVKGLENVGITDALGEALAWLSTKGTLEAIIATTFCTAFGSNLINNWSMMMVSVSSLASVSNPVASFDHSLIYSSILGADLGPNIAILGSLSSMLWLVLLRRRGLDIHPLQYLKLGLIVTPPMLIVGALALYASNMFWG